MMSCDLSPCERKYIEHTLSTYCESEVASLHMPLSISYSTKFPSNDNFNMSPSEKSRLTLLPGM